MIVLVLLIIAAVVFGIAAIYHGLPPRNEWPGGLVAAALSVLAAALAFWHAGK